MKKVILLTLIAMLAMPAFAQNKKPQTKPAAPKEENSAIVPHEKALDKVYDENRDPMEMLESAIEDARSSSRMILAQVGGNWCSWCLQFAQLVNEDKEIAEVVKENFVYVHINVPREKEKRNMDVMKRLGNPGRFGYPALVVLDQEGNVVHIENSSYLEQGKGYDHKKVLQFFKNWTMKAIEDLK